jgi:probable phosphomutase (TIGR03848 family)
VSPMTTVLLVRHGRSTANTSGVLAGQAPGVLLDRTGRVQAEGLRDRLRDVRIDRLVSSPMDRCRDTLQPLADALGLAVETDDRLAEVDYGDWTGRALKDLAEEKLWRVVQQHPAAARFPAGESLAAVSARAVAAVRDLVRADDPAAAAPDRADGATPPTAAAGATPAGGEGAATSAGDPHRSRTVVVCSHGDVIKAVLADALGMHLDSFQRIVVAPASLSVVRYTALRPFVERINDTGDLDSLRPPPPAAAAVAGADADAAAAAEPDPARRPDPIAESDAVPGGVVR